MPRSGLGRSAGQSHCHDDMGQELGCTIGCVRTHVDCRPFVGCASVNVQLSNVKPITSDSDSTVDVSLMCLLLLVRQDDLLASVW